MVPYILIYFPVPFSEPIFMTLILYILTDHFVLRFFINIITKVLI